MGPAYLRSLGEAEGIRYNGSQTSGPSQLGAYGHCGCRGGIGDRGLRNAAPRLSRTHEAHDLGRLTPCTNLGSCAVEFREVTMAKICSAAFFLLLQLLCLAPPVLADLVVDEQLCVRLSQKADSPEMWRQASNTCIAAAVDHKNRADRLSGARRQQELLMQAAFMVFAAVAERHGGDESTRRGPLVGAKSITSSVQQHAETPSIRADAERGTKAVRREEEQ